MPRRHQHTYRRPKPVLETLADLEREFGPKPQSGERPQRPTPPLIDYRGLVTVIGLVIFGLAMVTSLLAMIGL
jgi:hypothetical protein